jgi:hypothetical protein
MLGSLAMRSPTSQQWTTLKRMAANAKKLSSSILTLLASAGVKITMMVSASAGARILMILLSQPADATMDISAFHMRGTMI